MLLMGKSTISMAIFNTKLLVYQTVTIQLIVDLPIKNGDFPVRKLLVSQAGYPMIVGSQ